MNLFSLLRIQHRSPTHLEDLLAGSRTINLKAGLWCVLVPPGYRAIVLCNNRAKNLRFYNIVWKLIECSGQP